MEPLAHTLAGAALARTSLGRRTRLAGAALVLGAVVPDIDVLSYAWGADAALGFRRGWTHGPPALLLMAGVLTIGLWVYDARQRRRDPDLPRANVLGLLLAATIGVATHPFLDWLNTYGIRLLMPFDPRWFYGDALFIVDPWLWLILGGSLFLGRGSSSSGRPWLWILLATLTSSLVLGVRGALAAGPKLAWIAELVLLLALDKVARGRWARERLAVWGVLLASVYVLLLLSVTTVGSSWVSRELLRQGIDEIEELMLAPAPANPFRWSVVAETPQAYVCGSYSWLGGPRLSLADPPIAKPLPSPVLDAARKAPGVQGTLGWMRFPFAEIEQTQDGYTVYFLDARYVRARTRGFGGAVVRLDRDLRIQED